MGGESEKADAAKEPVTVEVAQQCLEELLSKANLQHDGFIQQNMNAQLYVPLCVLAGHQKFVSLGKEVNISLLLEGAKKSEKLAVDEVNMLVRPNIQAKRNTLILHDLPEGLPVEELKELFTASPEGENLVSVEPNVNQTAYAIFKTEEAAQNAALWLRSQKLRGEAVKCAVKAEHLMRSFFRAPAVPPTAWSGQSPWMGASANPWMGGGYDPAMMEQWMSEKGKGKFKGKDGKFKGKEGKEGKDGKEGKGKGKDGKDGKGKGKDMAQVPVSPPLTGTYADPTMQQFDLGEQAEYEPGYTHEYRKYTRDEIIEVCSGMGEVEKPASYARLEKEEAGLALFRQNPNKDWAPLPTPMSTFVSMGNRKPTNSFDSGHDGDWSGARSRKRSSSRNASWRRPSRERRSEDHGNADWENWDSSWADDGRWDDSKDWNWNDWGNWSKPQWVPKDRSETQDGETDAGKKADGGEDGRPKTMSWAEKVKSGQRAGSPPRWRAKAKDESGDGAAGGDAAADTTQQPAGGTSADKAASSAAAAAPAANADTDAAAAQSGPVSWADKVKMSSSPK